MSKQGEYRLSFANYKVDGRLAYKCTCWRGDTTSFNIAEVLSALSNDAHELLKEIENSLTGKYFEEYYRFDVHIIRFQITATHCVINDETEIPIQEFKMILEEWIAFCNKPFH